LKLHVLIPMKSLKASKSRLASILNLEERKKLTLCMLQDMAETLRKAKPPVSKIFLATSDLKLLDLAETLGMEPLRENADLGVNSAVSLGVKRCLEERGDALLVLPGDLPLLSPGDLQVLAELGQAENSLVITPSLRFDGTNALLLHPPNLMETSYDRDSFKNHLASALSRSLTVKVYLSLRVMLDLDLPEDLQHFLRLKAGLNTETYRFAAGLRLV